MSALLGISGAPLWGCLSYDTERSLYGRRYSLGPIYGCGVCPQPWGPGLVLTFVSQLSSVSFLVLSIRILLWPWKTVLFPESCLVQLWTQPALGLAVCPGACSISHSLGPAFYSVTRGDLLAEMRTGFDS